MSRYLRRIVAVVLLSLSLAVPSVVVAQDATPSPAESLLTALGYPELHVTITDTAIEAPAEVPAGLTLLTVENTSKEDTGVFLIAPPPGVSLNDFRATAEAPPPAGATPGAEEEFPSWFYDAILSGGPSVGPGGRGQIVIDLQPGDWAVASEGNQEPSLLTVTEATPTAAAEPTASLSVDLQEYAITIPQRVDPGPQIWKLSNIGQQPHVMYMVKTPRLLTMDEVMTLAQLPEEGTPPAGLPNPAEIEDIGGMTIMSAGRTAWMAFDLQPGYYVAICFIPDKVTHEPHVALGMVSIFTVGGSAPGATPAASPQNAASGTAVEIKDFAFNPPTITVPAGTTVTWTNQDSAPHTATADDKSFDTGRIEQGKSASVTFDKPGTYTYTCTFHPNMKGTVVVT